jgi:hypothetical protein
MHDAEATYKWHQVAHGKMRRLGKATAGGRSQPQSSPACAVCERFSCTRNQFLASILQRA